jgi:hypothetical protein
LKVKAFLLIILFFSPLIFSQTDFTIGGSFGGGSFSGNTASVSGFTSSLYAEVNIPLFEEVYPRASFIMVKDINALLPNTQKPYLPYLAGASFKGVTYQFFDSKIFLEEGAGLLALNDNTLSDTNIWDYGIVISFSVGYDLRNYNLKGFKLGAGAEYGITFFNTLPKYSSIHVFAQFTI